MFQCVFYFSLFLKESLDEVYFFVLKGLFLDFFFVIRRIGVNYCVCYRSFFREGMMGVSIYILEFMFFKLIFFMKENRSGLLFFNQCILRKKFGVSFICMIVFSFFKWIGIGVIQCIFILYWLIKMCRLSDSFLQYLCCNDFDFFYFRVQW